ncbi:Hypothetical protein CINCED_3A002225 [Cinara cedri]|uniref:Uncharacterized protein n=1 Tax=Cinara cedri TaxID=506608 RepID=A0A5E4NHL5_9HEMI|nr:Hypothetical protein CINCED_3A002225 [Cinara cedri]
MQLSQCDISLKSVRFGNCINGKKTAADRVRAPGTGNPESGRPRDKRDRERDKNPAVDVHNKLLV